MKDWLGMFTALCFGGACVCSFILNGFGTETVALWAAAQAAITAVKVKRLERESGRA